MATKLNKQAEILNELHNMVKQAAAGKATGKPGADTHYQAVSDKHDTTDKNKVGPEKLKPQSHEQHPQTDPSTPVKAGEEAPATEATPASTEAAKTAEAAPAPAPAPEAATSEKTASQIGKEILEMIEKAGKAGTATGKPGADTHYQAVSDKHDTTDKNKVGPEKLKPQSHEQHPQTDPSTPVKAATELSPEEAEKKASIEFGKLLAQELAASMSKSAQDQEITLAKEAGRRDFEQLIAQAAQELEANELQIKQAAELEKEAEQAGANAFYELVNQAQNIKTAQQVAPEPAKPSELEVKLAAAVAQMETLVKRAEEAEKAREAELRKTAAEQAEMAKWASMTDYVAKMVAEHLKNEVAKS